MSNEELYLKERVGTDNHFTVPEGYFEQLTEQVMSRLPGLEVQTLSDEQTAANTVPLDTTERKAAGGKHQGMLVRMRPWLYAAACVAALAVMVFSLHKEDQTTVEPALAATSVVEEEFMDEAADYAMLDNMDIYACLADNF
jgi:hypothetical protein